MRRALLFALTSAALWAQKPAILSRSGIDQKPGAQAPLDLAFTDESGQPVTLRKFSGKPIVLALVYYQCPSLCNMVLSGLLRSAKPLSLTAGEDFEIVAVSFDPRDTNELAAAKKQSYLKSYARGDWHFLTGNEVSTKALAAAVGFHYSFDTMTNQYAHSASLIVLTPEGKVARYLYGIEYPPRDLKLALVEASDRRIATISDQVLLYCFHYDPSTGKYGFLIMSVLRAMALATLGCLAIFLGVHFRRDFSGGRDG
jgi:protein SCO1/2